MNRFALLQIHYVETNMFVEADEAIPILAIDREWRNPTFTDFRDMLEKRIVARAEYPKICFRTQIGKAPVKARNAVMGSDSGRQPFYKFAVFGIHDQESAIRPPEPPARGNVQFAAIRGDACPVAAAIVLFLPKHT